MFTAPINLKFMTPFPSSRNWDSRKKLQNSEEFRGIGTAFHFTVWSVNLS